MGTLLCFWPQGSAGNCSKWAQLLEHGERRFIAAQKKRKRKVQEQEQCLFKSRSADASISSWGYWLFRVSLPHSSQARADSTSTKGSVIDTFFNSYPQQLNKRQILWKVIGLDILAMILFSISLFIILYLDQKWDLSGGILGPLRSDVGVFWPFRAIEFINI